MPHLWEIEHDDGDQPSPATVDASLMRLAVKIQEAAHPARWFDDVHHMSEYFHGRHSSSAQRTVHIPIQWEWIKTADPTNETDVLNVVLWEVRMNRPVTFSCSVSQFDEPAVRQLLHEMGAAAAARWQLGQA